MTMKGLYETQALRLDTTPATPYFFSFPLATTTANQRFYPVIGSELSPGRSGLPEESILGWADRRQRRWETPDKLSKSRQLTVSGVKM